MIIFDILDIRLVITDSQFGNPIVDVLHNDRLYRFLERIELRCVSIDLLVFIIRDLVDEFGPSRNIKTLSEVSQSVRRENKISGSCLWIESPSYKEYEDKRHHK